MVKRINISVPEDVIEQMNGFDFNWSAIATDAFKQAMTNNTQTKEIIKLKNDNKKLRETLIAFQSAIKESLEKDN